MADTVSVEQENGTEAVDNTQEQRTFTQEELNAIIESRLRKESAKYSDYEELKAKASKFDAAEEAQKTELQKATEKADALQKQLDDMAKAAEVRSIKDKISAETGVPASLLTGETEEACRSQAQGILSFAKPSYPSVKDGGEVHTSNITKADILAIKDEKARLKAIEEHIELF